jgi:hypothetical protein
MMPGFVVQGTGSATSPPSTPYYKYTWEIATLFGEAVRPTDSPIIYAKEATLPNWEVDLVEVMGASLKYKFAGHMNFGDIKIVWYDTEGLADEIIKWRDKVWTPDKGVQQANDYKQDSAISSLAFDDSAEVKWSLHGSWPRAVRVGDLSYVDSDIKSVEATVVYDWADKE